MYNCSKSDSKIQNLHNIKSKRLLFFLILFEMAIPSNKWLFIPTYLLFGTSNFISTFLSIWSSFYLFKNQKAERQQLCCTQRCNKSVSYTIDFMKILMKWRLYHLIRPYKSNNLLFLYWHKQRADSLLMSNYLTQFFWNWWTSTGRVSSDNKGDRNRYCMSAFVFWFWDFQRIMTVAFKLDDMKGLCLLQSPDQVSQKAESCVALTPCFRV